MLGETFRPLSEILLPNFQNDESEIELRAEMMKQLEFCKSQVEREIHPAILYFYRLFCSPENKTVHSKILKELNGFETILELVNLESITETTRSYALYTLWNLSAISENKVELYEMGIADEVLKLKFDAERVLVGISAILQNISEHRFDGGEKNPNQVHIYQCGAFKFFHEHINSQDLFVRFLSCMGIANLSFNSEVRKLMKEDQCESVLHHLLDFVSNYENIRHEPHSRELFEGWLSLQPHIPLLASDDESIQIWALFCVSEFIQNASQNDAQRLISSKREGKISKPTYQQIWRDLGINEGIRPIQKLTFSKNPKISQMAHRLIQLLKIQGSMGLSYRPNSNTGMDFQLTLESETYSDVTFRSRDDKEIKAHKIILASRCRPLASIFEGGFKESKMEVIPIQFSYGVFKSFLEYLYTGIAPNIVPSTALELLNCADMFTVDELKRHVEEFLWNFIEPTNVVMILEASERHRCPRLRWMCVQFVIRNFKKVERTPEWAELDLGLKLPIQSYRNALEANIRKLNDEASSLLEERQRESEMMIDVHPNRSVPSAAAT